MRVKRLVMLAMSIVLIAQVGSYSQAPPFSEKVSLLGSTVYNAEDNGANDPDSDWLVDRTDVLSGSIVMDKEGLVFVPGDSSNESVRHQLKRGFQVGDGQASAAFRIKVSDLATLGFIVGFYNEDSDPYSGQPTYAAYFQKSPGATQEVVMHVHDGEEMHNDSSFPIEVNTAYDLVVQINGNGTNTVTFNHRESGDPDWCPHSVTTNVPPDTADLYFSMAAITSTGANQKLTVQLFEFEADAGG